MRYFLFSLYTIITFVVEAKTYVLLQVRKKDGNHSNIDAIIHKVVPAGKFNEIAKIINVKKQNDSDNYEIRAGDDYRLRRNHERKLDDVNTLIETDSNEDVKDKGLSNINNIKTFVKVLFDLVKDNGKAILRASAKNINIRPEVVHFRKEKPSIVFEINSKSILKTINDFLSSKIFKDSVDNLSRRAAVVYRSMKDKIEAD